MIWGGTVCEGTAAVRDGEGLGTPLQPCNSEPGMSGAKKRGRIEPGAVS